MKNKPHESPDCKCPQCREWTVVKMMNDVLESLRPLSYFTCTFEVPTDVTKKTRFPEEK